MGMYSTPARLPMFGTSCRNRCRYRRNSTAPCHGLNRYMVENMSQKFVSKNPISNASRIRDAPRLSSDPRISAISAAWCTGSSPIVRVSTVSGPPSPLATSLTLVLPRFLASPPPPPPRTYSSSVPAPSSLRASSDPSSAGSGSGDARA